MRAGVLAAYAVPATAVWALLGLALTAVPLRWLALPLLAAYGGYYGALELTGRSGLPVPGRSWQVPQSMLIGAPPRRRLLVWGALLGPGFATRNPYAGFWLLPAAIAAMPGPAAGVVLGTAVGCAHGSARAAALLRDVAQTRAVAAGVPVAVSQDALTGHLDALLKTVYWRRFDGAVLLTTGLLAAAILAAAALARLIPA